MLLTASPKRIEELLDGQIAIRYWVSRRSDAADTLRGPGREYPSRLRQAAYIGATSRFGAFRIAATVTVLQQVAIDQRSSSDGPGGRAAG